MCKSPRKPQRNPKPSAIELSGSKCSAESLSCELLERVAKLRDLDAFVGIEAAVDHRHDRLVAGAAPPGAGLPASVIVSPTSMSPSDLMFAIT
jgi:hypothetical protein